ncbi:ubiquitin-conjugating enzyme E2 Z-like [Agrilus planipennis]|uniref:Ubiquitin-conjugating enzyme E2 Z n=1 Tax=Agrilus planipennis TaxID=224129 RepID=A0A1W4WT27_AGRPL|nr:ubiquitin-conjugating enzyme E2 Z-like [Agrilus planipennis]
MCNDLISFKSTKCVKVHVHSLGALTECHGTVDLSHSQWNPINDKEVDALSHTASARIKRDMVNFFNDPPFGLYAVLDEDNLKLIHAIIIGVANTPYEGGFFYFILKCPNDYPFHPPKVKLMTTDVENVQFSPNFSRIGKVYLSILG